MRARHILSVLLFLWMFLVCFQATASKTCKKKSSAKGSGATKTKMPTKCKTQNTDSICKPKWTYLPVSGRCVQRFRLKLSYYKAEVYCRKLKATLITVKTREERDELNDKMWFNDMYGLIGLADLDADRKFTWNDGDELVWSSWRRGEPNNYGGNEYCVQQSHGEWNDISCAAKQLFTCQYKTIASKRCKKKSPTKKPTKGICQPKWTYLPDSKKCVRRFNHESMDYYQAEAYCGKFNATLITVKTREERDELDSKMWFNDMYGLIGLADLDADRKFTWNDGDELAWSSWRRGEPNNYGGIEYCVHHYMGEWNDVRCRSKTFFTCQYKTIA